MSAPPKEKIRAPIGLAAFDTLRAEDEAWLLDCFIPPADFERMASERSIIVFGDAGAGKTAVCHALVQGLYRESKPTRLIVEWQPVPPDDVPADLTGVRRQIHLVFDACAFALVNYLMQYPDQWQRTPEWTHTTIAWFIHTFTQGDLKTRLEKWTTEASPLASVILQAIRENTSQVLQPSASPDYIIAELVKALQPFGLDGIWIVADGLEKWVTIEPERLATDLANFLSALILFERTKLVYKFFVPQHLESGLCAATGVQRRRLDSYRLQWDASALQTMVERRLALATGIKGFTLAHLCATPAPKKTRSKKTPEKQLTLLDWLQAAGGTNPREWLDQVRPLVQHYLEHRLNRPIDATTWRELRRNHPPRLYFDDSKKQVIVGGRAVPLEQIPAQAYEMLRYLIKHSNQLVSKADLYFQSYLGLDRIPRKGEKEFREPIEYEGLIDTNLWRLRQAIEPDPTDPVLLLTIKGHGVKLNVRW